jgi:hypothetical protein
MAWDWTIWKKEVTITSYDIDNDVNDAIITDDIHIERNTSVTGEIYGTLNVFRNVLPGYFWCEFLFNAGLCNSKPLPVEVILVTENTRTGIIDWFKFSKHKFDGDKYSFDKSLAHKDINIVMKN